MAIRTQRNKATAGRCLICETVATCASFTMYENNSGFGWASAGTLLLCADCLRDAGEDLSGVERFSVLEAQLREAGVVLPRNATLDALLALAQEHGLRPAVSIAEGADTAPARGTLRWWQAEAAARGVPLLDGMTRAQIERRIELWELAAAVGIELYEGMDNEQAAAALEASAAARVGSQPPADDAGGPATEVADVKDFRAKSGAAGEVPAAPRGRTAPITGNLAPP